MISKNNEFGNQNKSSYNSSNTITEVNGLSGRNNNFKPHLIETNRVETQAKIEKSNGSPIKDAKAHHSSWIKRLVLKQFHP